jgi:hypothetical protein
MALKAGAKRLGLFHLNRERTDADMNRIVEHCRQITDQRNATMDCFAVAMDMAFEV